MVVLPPPLEGEGRRRLKRLIHSGNSVRSLGILGIGSVPVLWSGGLWAVRDDEVAVAVCIYIHDQLMSDACYVHAHKVMEDGVEITYNSV